MTRPKYIVTLCESCWFKPNSQTSHQLREQRLWASSGPNMAAIQRGNEKAEAWRVACSRVTCALWRGLRGEGNSYGAICRHRPRHSGGGGGGGSPSGTKNTAMVNPAGLSSNTHTHTHMHTRTNMYTQSGTHTQDLTTGPMLIGVPFSDIILSELASGSNNDHNLFLTDRKGRFSQWDIHSLTHSLTHLCSLSLNL